MLQSEKVIQKAHHGGYGMLYPPNPWCAMRRAALSCEISNERVREIIRTHGTLVYSDPPQWITEPEYSSIGELTALCSIKEEY